MTGGDHSRARMRCTREWQWSSDVMKWHWKHGQIGWSSTSTEQEHSCSSWASPLTINCNNPSFLSIFLVLQTFPMTVLTKCYILVSSYRAGDWGMPEDQNCYNETQPISRMDYWGRATDKGLMHTAEKVIQRLETKGLRIQYINITQLSDYRKDGHTSIYRRQWQPPTEEQLLDPKSYSDCVHWCLPGVPDVWNNILYAYIMDQNS